ncbi:MAG: guanylate kinase [Deltaproteobacteria bacterium]|nr:guanylate kinase [Deltaproteobacteria bacterium]MBW2659957.1 guanylate kinase [Deltaproteobacteria bacterium]
MNRGILFVISAPSGAGKTTLLKRVMAQVPALSFSISHTTRKPRTGEVDGVDYYFILRTLFLQMVDDQLFIEHARVHDNFYGTSHKGVEVQLEKGQDVILDIDVQGAAIVRERQSPAGVHIFIAPPTLTELERRLRGRCTESDEQIGVRLSNAKVEMGEAKKYDYIIVNDQLEEAADLLISIIHAERSRSRRLPSGEPITGISI